VKVVWVLGAGFSCSVGGPLLGHFFSPIIERSLTHLPGDSHEVHAIYGFHQLKHPVKSSVIPWSDPESFLELLERSVHAGSSAEDRKRARRMLSSRMRIPNMSGRTKRVDILNDDERFQYLVKACRCYMATVCLKLINYSPAPVSERWDPYRHWAAQLTEEDTILTFNYDVVAERALQAVGKPFREILPGNGSTDTPNEPGPLLLKLHGSSSWAWVDETQMSVRRVNDPLEEMRSQTWEPAIVAPGPAKHDSVHGGFAHLWDTAEAMLQEADVIVFVGYRFPPTDAEARRRLLSAIASSRAHEPVMRIVLGPDPTSDVIRLEGMLKWALGPKAGAYGVVTMEEALQQVRVMGLVGRPVVVREPMWAEDFLSVFRREHLGIPGSRGARRGG
jgi:hypothetical protein